MAKAGRRYSAKLKFQVVVEALKGEKSPAQIAKAYRVHPNSVGLWKRSRSIGCRLTSTCSCRPRWIVRRARRRL